MQNNLIAPQEITCINCGWHWNTSDSDESDKYVCHKCGFDNKLFYDPQLMGIMADSTFLNLKKNGILLRDKENTIILIAYNTENQEKGTALYNKALIYKSVKPIRQANEIIEMLDNQQYEEFDESKIEDYKKSGHLIIMNQNEVVYDSEKPNLSYADGGTIGSFKKVKENYLGIDQSFEVVEYRYKDAAIRFNGIDNLWILTMQHDGKPEKTIGGYKTLKIAKEVGLYYLKNPKLYADGGLIASNGKKSNLTPEQYKLVRTPEFKSWFGDWENDPQNASKVIDENGEPLVVYRSVTPKSISQGHDYIAGTYNYSKEGYQYFAKNKNYARVHGYITKDFFLNIRDILDFNYYNNILIENGIYADYSKDGIFQISDEIEKEKPYLSQIIKVSNEIPDLSFEIKNKLKTSDGFYGYEKGFYGLEESYVVKKSNQIKLADGTNTTFDTANPDIRYVDGGETYKDIMYEKGGGFNKESGLKKLAKEKKATITNAFDQLKNSMKADQYKIVRTSEFKNWFGDWQKDPNNCSVVKEKNGEPMVVWHGSPSKFNIFKNVENGVFYFAENAGYASHFADGTKNTYPYFLNIRKIFDALKFDIKEYEANVFIKDFGINTKWLKSQAKLSKRIKFWELLRHDEDFRKYLIKQGYDGVRYVEDNDDSWIEKSVAYGCFNANQIKLANGVNTTFSIKSKDIRYEDGGYMAKGGLSKTPAPKKDRVFGSDKNKVGSAASKESAKKINLSDGIITTLSNKAKEYNEDNSGNKVTLNTLKAVMRRGMGAYSTSHRPIITGGAPNSRQAWGFARVNKFLKKKSGEKVKAAYVQDDDLLERGAILNLSCKDYISKNEAVLKTGYYLDLREFSSINDPYGQIPLNLKHTLVTYNSGNQDGLSLIDTINHISLQKELAQILNLPMNNAHVVVGLYIKMAKKLKSVSDIKSNNVIVMDRDRLVCKSDAGDLFGMGGTTNKNNFKMIQQHYHSMKPIENIQIGDIYVIKEDMFAPHQDHEHPQHLSTRYATVEVKSPCHRNLDSYTLEVMDCDCDNAAGRYAKGKVIERSRKHILSSGKLKSAVAKATEFKDGGELNADSQEVKEYFAHDSGNAGGLLVGKRHSEGGIKADVKSTGQQIEMEGGEAVITRGAVNSKKKYVYEGKDMTTREILSDLNVKGGGVAFADGGDVPEKMNCGCSSMKVGGISYTPQDFITLSEKEYQEHRLIDGIEKERTDHFYTLAKLNSGAISIEQALREIASKEMMIDPKYPYSE